MKPTKILLQTLLLGGLLTGCKTPANASKTKDNLSAASQTQTVLLVGYGGWESCQPGLQNSKIADSFMNLVGNLQQQGVSVNWILGCLNTLPPWRPLSTGTVLTSNNQAFNNIKMQGDLQQVVRKFTDGVKPDKIYYIGHSYGGWVVFNLLENNFKASQVFGLDPIDARSCLPVGNLFYGLGVVNQGCLHNPDMNYNALLQLTSRITVFYTDYPPIHSSPINSQSDRVRNVHVDVDHSWFHDNPSNPNQVNQKNKKDYTHRMIGSYPAAWGAICQQIFKANNWPGSGCTTIDTDGDGRRLASEGAGTQTMPDLGDAPDEPNLGDGGGGGGGTTGGSTGGGGGPSCSDPTPSCGSAIGMNSNTLYQCSGGQFQVLQQCPSGCKTNAPGQADVCNGGGGGTTGGGGGPSCFDPTPSCGGAIGMNSNTLYQCAGGHYQVLQQCPSGCKANPPGQADVCNSGGGGTTGGGGGPSCFDPTPSCGGAIGMNGNTLYQCSGGHYQVLQQCPSGCKTNAPGQADVCNGGGGGGSTGGGGGTSGILCGQVTQASKVCINQAHTVIQIMRSDGSVFPWSVQQSSASQILPGGTAYYGIANLASIQGLSPQTQMAFIIHPNGTAKLVYYTQQGWQNFGGVPTFQVVEQ